MRAGTSKQGKIFSAFVVLGLMVGVLASLALAREGTRRHSSAMPVDEMLHATSETVHTRLSTKPLDPSMPLDGQLLSLMKALDTLHATKTTVFRADGMGAFAHPDAGIGVDHDQIEAWRHELGPTQFHEVLRLVLAHEQAHMLQYRYYTRASVLDRRKTRAVEGQADILAGVSAVWLLLRERQDVVAGQAAIKKYRDFSLKIGCPLDDQTKHPDSGQRARLVTLGLLAAFQYSDLDLYKRTKAEDALQRIVKGKVQNNDLPNFDERRLKIENVFEWSNRVAKQITRYVEPKASGERR